MAKDENEAAPVVPVEVAEGVVVQRPEIDPVRAVELIQKLMARFKGTTFEMLEEVLLPLQAPIVQLDRELKKFGKHYGAEFAIDKGTEHPTITRGRSGKVVPASFLRGETNWRELLKARIHEAREAHAKGELHYTGQKAELAIRIETVNEGDIFEIDRYGITAKLESALTEAALVAHALERGYKVTRLPEDIAQHLGEYWHIDFMFEKDGVSKRIESKSLWGTDTSKARLIHSKGKGYETSSCKYATQDIFAVNLWLRTGIITDIAFAKSVRKDAGHPYGLPCATKRGGGMMPDYVGQNPSCTIGDGTWFGTVDEVWNLA